MLRAGPSIVAFDVGQTAIEVDVTQVAVEVSIDQAAPVFEIGNSVACAVDHWPSFRRVIVTYMGKPVTFNGKPVYVVREA